jgi:anti-sigma regulatory factor (Ser/Thr protein kinase)
LFPTVGQFGIDSNRETRGRCYPRFPARADGQVDRGARSLKRFDRMPSQVRRWCISELSDRQAGFRLKSLLSSSFSTRLICIVATSEYALAVNASSCADARRHILDALVGTPEEVGATAALLGSELVANAFLHATGPITLTVRQEGSLIRVEVGDGGTMPPAVKTYGVRSATGRGLQLLDELAATWGWQPSGSGKVVWFELSKDGPCATKETRGMRRPTDPLVVDPYPSGLPVVLLHAPVQAMIRAGASYDAMYRELHRRVNDDRSTADTTSVRLFNLLQVISTQFRGFGRSAEDIWQGAVEDGAGHVTLSFLLPPEAGTIVERYGHLLDEAEEYCQAWLPAVATSEEARAVRRWAFGEVTNQLSGERPLPWPDEL